MNIAQHSTEIEREVGNLGVMSWLSRHQPLPSANETWLGTILLVERIGVFPASGDIRRPMRDPYPLLAHLKALYGEQALEMDDRDGLKVIFSDWRFRVRICCNDPAITPASCGRKSRKALDRRFRRHVAAAALLRDARSAAVRA